MNEKTKHRHDWTEWHLTPRGWESGSTRVTGAGTTWRDEPEDRILSCVYRERTALAQDETATASSRAASSEESWRSKDAARLAMLDEHLRRFGPCPNRL